MKIARMELRLKGTRTLDIFENSKKIIQMYGFVFTNIQYKNLKTKPSYYQFLKISYHKI